MVVGGYMIGYVYLTTNLVNNKKYVGQHEYAGKQLDPEYVGSGKLLSKAIKKYGKENFSCEILEWCDTKENLNIREKFWIDHYNAIDNENFYNLAAGGTGGFTMIGSSSEEKESAMKKRKETWRKNGTWARVAQERRQHYIDHPEDRATVGKRIHAFYADHPEERSKAAERAHNRVWTSEFRQKHKEGLLRGELHFASRKCICIETQKVFISATAAAEYYGGSYKVIWKCCKNQCETAAGYHWAFIEDTDKQQELAQFIGAPRKIFRNSKSGYKN